MRNLNTNKHLVIGVVLIICLTMAVVEGSYKNSNTMFDPTKQITSML